MIVQVHKTHVTKAKYALLRAARKVDELQGGRFIVDEAQAAMIEAEGVIVIGVEEEVTPADNEDQEEDDPEE